ncbi:S-adenosylmethionine:tRNA ribosyltransferase-isomerase [Streptomyces sp. TRM68367]|uniref:S-adenosylmethionine:tRNA ribosyltransferase-isomerase n=1 Tax=Streptomyces sp. TRM68367 TaxID=2758415 RepID=UPI0037DD5573
MWWARVYEAEGPGGPGAPGGPGGPGRHQRFGGPAGAQGSADAEGPGSPEAPGDSEASGTPEAPGGPRTTRGPETPSTPETPDRPQTTRGPKAPGNPEAPGGPRTTRRSEAAGSGPKAPGNPDARRDPEATRVPETRRGPDRIYGLLQAYGRPVRYSYTERDQPLSVYQTVFALASDDGSGSAEMPSAARPFTARLVAELVSRGVQFAPVTLHTGVASAEAHEPPYPERFAVPEASARLINAVRAGDGRVIAVGTTAVRAVESAAGADGVVRARAGWTDLVVTPERGVRVVDGLLTGLHEPEASHLLMLEAIAGRAAIDRGYEEAVRRRYLWHEFGDVHLLLPADSGGLAAKHPHTQHCASNPW